MTEDDKKIKEIQEIASSKPPGGMDTGTYLLAQVVHGVGKLHSKVDAQADEVGEVKRWTENHDKDHEENPKHMAPGMIFSKWPKLSIFAFVVAVAIATNPRVQVALTKSWKFFLG